MSWEAVLCDTMSGRMVAPIDLPSFSWAVTVSDSELSTSRDKGAGDMGGDGLTVPWGAVPAATQQGREDMLASRRRALALLWDGSPVLWGAIGERADTWEDTTFSLDSPLTLLSARIFCYEGSFGAGEGSTTTADASYRGWSLRGIASDMGWWCTNRKPGGELPIDWSYLGERGSHDRTYYGFNAQNNDCRKLFDEMTNVAGGPDMQFRPYVTSDGQHVRLRFEAGTDAEPYLSQSGLVPSLTAFPGGGTLDGVEVAHLGPVMRVYGTGAGEDKAQLCCLAEDLSLVQQADPWPLAEAVVSDSDWDNAGLLARHTAAALEASRTPLVQVAGTMHADDPRAPRLGSFWPGQLMELDIEGYPSLPDGTYRMRLMEMGGDETDAVRLVFDAMPNPWYR